MARLIMKISAILNQILESLGKKLSTNKRLVENFSYLSVLQIFNLVIPLITYPYLIRVLGKENYGLIVLAQATVSYFVIVVNFGYNIYGTKEISINRDNPLKINEIVSSILLIKLGLIIVAFGILTIVIFIFRPEGDRILYYLTMHLCFFELLFPIWYFQGIEKMKFITYITLTSRLIFTFLIFFTIKDENDILLVPIINGIGTLFAGIVSLYILFSVQKVRFSIQPAKTLWNYIKGSYILFISHFSVSAYSNAGKILIGIYLGLSDLAYYDLAEKVLRIVRIPLNIFGQVTFPRNSLHKSLNRMMKNIRINFIGAFLIYFMLFVFSKQVILLLGGQEMLPSMHVLKIILLALFPISLSIFISDQIMIIWDLKRAYFLMRVFTGIFYFIFFALLLITNRISLISLAFLFIFTEIYALLHSIVSIKRNI